MIRDQLLKLSQVEMRHCVLLGRLEGIAESLDVSLCLSIVFPFNFAVCSSQDRRPQMSGSPLANDALFLPPK
jgi:hypothetical protein